jgi:hypothetical protein
MLADDRNGLGGGDVEPGAPVLIPRSGAEILLNNLLSPRKFVATAHKGIMADRPRALLDPHGIHRAEHIMPRINTGWGSGLRGSGGNHAHSLELGR